MNTLSRSNWITVNEDQQVEATIPMGYARALKPRISFLLEQELPRSIRRQLEAVKVAIDDEALTECTGLDNLHYALNEWERRYI